MASEDRQEPTTGERIRKARTQMGLTQVQLAGIVGVDSVTVSRWERDVFAPDPDRWQRLRRLLSLDDEAA